MARQGGTVSEELDPKVVESVYADILSIFKGAAKGQGRDVGDAEDVATETVARMLKSHQKEPINNPLHWARHTAANLWKDLGRTERRHISYDGVEGVSRDDGAWRRHEGEDKGQDIVNKPEHEKRKLFVPLVIREEMAEAVTEPRSPELIAEQRDFLQKIDPEWRAHMEEGYDFGSKKKLDRNTRRQIQRRARQLLKEKT
jgi:DNA-directed RNA polymerase specialized sigma24 family protein